MRQEHLSPPLEPWARRLALAGRILGGTEEKIDGIPTFRDTVSSVLT
jgi:hypothetical protein